MKLYLQKVDYHPTQFPLLHLPAHLGICRGREMLSSHSVSPDALTETDIDADAKDSLKTPLSAYLQAEERLHQGAILKSQEKGSILKSAWSYISRFLQISANTILIVSVRPNTPS